MEVVIDPKLKGYVDECLAQGTYSTFDDMVNRALVLLQKRTEQVTRLNQLIAEGHDDAINGRYSPGDEVRERLRKSRENRS